MKTYQARSLKRAKLVRDQFKAVDQLLSSPRKWTRNSWARDRRGDDVDPDTRHAVCWCLGGAWQKNGSGLPAASMEQFLPKDFKGYIAFNDSAKTRFDDVKDMLKRGIRAWNKRVRELAV